MKLSFSTIKDFPKYLISSIGIVYSLRADGSYKPLKQYDNKDGYKRVKLFNNNTTKQVLVHILVFRTFIDPEHKTHTLQIDHIDRNKVNNSIDNLRAVTQEMNLNNRGGMFENTKVKMDNNNNDVWELDL